MTLKWGWSPRSDPTKITWFLPEGTSIDYGQMYIYGGDWEADLDKRNQFSIQLHYQNSNGEVTPWDYLTYVLEEPFSSPINFEIGFEKTSFNERCWYLRQKGTECFRAQIDEFQEVEKPTEACHPVKVEPVEDQKSDVMGERTPCVKTIRGAE